MQQLGKNSFDGAHAGPGRPAIAKNAGKAAAGLGDCLDPVMALGDGLTAQEDALQQLLQQQEDNNARCQTLRGALHFILVPEPDAPPAAHCSPLSTSGCCSPMHAAATAEGSGNACTDPRDTPAASGSEGPPDLSHLMQQQLGQGAATAPRVLLAPRVPTQQQLQHHRHPSMLSRMGYSLSDYMALSPTRLAGGGSAAAGSAYPRLHRLSNTQLPVAKSTARRRRYGPSTASVRSLDSDARHANALHGRVGRTLGLGLEAPAVGTKTRRGASLDQTAVMVEGDQAMSAPLSGTGCLLLLHARASSDNASPPQSHAQRTSDNRAACLLMTSPSYAAMMAVRASAESQEAGGHTFGGRGDGWPAASGGTQEHEVEVDVTESDEAVVAAPPSAAMLDEVGTCYVTACKRVKHVMWLAASTGHMLTAVRIQGKAPIFPRGYSSGFLIPPPNPKIFSSKTGHFDRFFISSGLEGPRTDVRFRGIAANLTQLFRQISSFCQLFRKNLSVMTSDIASSLDTNGCKHDRYVSCCSSPGSMGTTQGVVGYLHRPCAYSRLCPSCCAVGLSLDRSLFGS